MLHIHLIDASITQAQRNNQIADFFSKYPSGTKVKVRWRSTGASIWCGPATSEIQRNAFRASMDLKNLAYQWEITVESVPTPLVSPSPSLSERTSIMQYPVFVTVLDRIPAPTPENPAATAERTVIPTNLRFIESKDSAPAIIRNRLLVEASTVPLTPPFDPATATVYQNTIVLNPIS